MKRNVGSLLRFSVPVDQKHHKSLSRFFGTQVEACINRNGFFIASLYNLATKRLARVFEQKAK